MKKLILLSILLPLQSGAQPLTLSVDSAVALALQNNRAIHASGMKAEAAHARSSEVRTNLLPSLKLQAAYTRLSDVDPFAVQLPFIANPIVISPVVLNTYSTRLTLQQPLFTGFRLWGAARSADHTANAAELDFANDRMEMGLAVKIAYWNLFKAEQMRKVVEENVAQIKAHRTDVQNFMNQGLATRNDILRVDVQVSQSELMLVDAKNSVIVASMMLNNLIGHPLKSEIELSSSPDTTGASAYYSVEKAMESRTDVRALRARVEAGHASVTASRGGWFPQIFLIGNYYYARPNQRILPTRDEFKDTWDLGIAMSFDLWNWRSTSHQTRQAEAALAQANDALNLLQDRIHLDLEQSLLELSKSKQKVEIAKGGVELAEENLSVARGKYRTGLATNTEVLDAEVSLVRAKMEYVAALADVQIAKVRLERASGLEH